MKIEQHHTAPNPHVIGFNDEINNRDRIPDLYNLGWNGLHQPYGYKLARLEGARDQGLNYLALDESEMGRLKRSGLQVIGCRSSDRWRRCFVKRGTKAGKFAEQVLTLEEGDVTVYQGQNR